VARREQQLSEGMKMIKKSIFAITVLALLACTAQAGHLKKYDWSCTFDYVAVDIKIPVYIDIGLVINITNQTKIKIILKQDTAVWNTYVGTLVSSEPADNNKMLVKCNFPLMMKGGFIFNDADPNNKGSSTGAVVVDGWPKFNGLTELPIPSTVGGAAFPVGVELKLKNVAVENLKYQKNFLIGWVTILVKPTFPCIWQDP
jgi:hypothetical protein